MICHLNRFLFFLPSLFVLNAQTLINDSVSIGAQYVNKAYYSLSGGIVSVLPNDQWDLQLASGGPTLATIRLNGGFNVAAWLYTSGDTSSWSTLDTAGLGSGSNYTRIYDAVNAYDPGAFESTQTGFPNYGWGTYSLISHHIIGDKLYIVRTLNGQYKKLWIEILRSTTQTFEFRIADLDGSNEQQLLVDRSADTDKHFIYLNLNTGAVYKQEPVKGSYELIFEKYEGFLASSNMYYPVSGVRLAPNAKGTRVSGKDIDDVVISDYTSGTDIVCVGHDWKTFAMGWSLSDSLSFLLEDSSGDLWQLWFTGFSGGSTGTFYFTKRKLQSLSLAENNEALVSVFPNPCSDVLHVSWSADSGTLWLTDINGRIIRQVSYSGEGASLFVSDLPSGIYLLRGLSGKDGFVRKVRLN
jgi:hypothetical protein